MIRRRHRTILVFTAAAVMLACAPVFAPTAAPIPTFDPNSPLTAIVETANAAAAQTEIFAPPTQAPADTPTLTIIPTETATPTFVFILPTATVPPTPIKPGSSGLEYQCQVVSQIPARDSIMARDAEFDARWQVSNVGKSAWLSTDTDYRYHSGNKLHTQAAYDFELSVPSGMNIELTVKMKSPSEPGIYKTEWRITVGNRSFCPLIVSIIVN